MNKIMSKEGDFHGGFRLLMKKEKIMTKPNYGIEKLSYDDMHQYYSYALKQMIHFEDDKKRYSPDVIVSIFRGGSDFGIKLSHRTKRPTIPLMYQMRDGIVLKNNLGHVTEMLTEKQEEKGEKLSVLLVDDIADSGITLRTLRSFFENNSFDIKVAVGISDIAHITNNLVDYYGRVINRNVDKQWFIFPWEDANLNINDKRIEY